jgi:hypothetical protein
MEHNVEFVPGAGRPRCAGRWRVVAAGIVAVVLALLSLPGYCLYRNYAIKQGYALVKMGDARNKAIILMGQPNRVVLPGDAGSWTSGVKGCVNEYQYDASLWPEIWVIGFDANDTVVYRNHNIM